MIGFTQMNCCSVYINELLNLGRKRINKFELTEFSNLIIKKPHQIYILLIMSVLDGMYPVMVQ